MIFEIVKKDLSQTRWIAEEFSALGPDQVRFKIESYALTANNITYAVVGEKLNYWEFYPASNPEMGIIPVWGFAKVEESSHPDITKGSRYFGYWPMANHCVLSIGKIFEDGFMDATEYRRNLPSVYNLYNDITKDLVYKSAFESLQSIYRPLFATSFLLFHYLIEQQFLDANQVVFTSASSKTALSLAHLIRQHKSRKLNCIALSSESNLGFVRQTTLYDEVLSYDQIGQIPEVKSIVVDFRGNMSLLNDVSEHLKSHRVYSYLIGLTDWQNLGSQKGLERAEFFFAPDHATKKTKEWGRMDFQQKLSDALYTLLSDAKTWTHLVEIRSNSDVEAVYKKLLFGNLKPEQALIVINE